MNVVIIATEMGIHPLLPVGLRVLIESALETAVQWTVNRPGYVETVTVVVSDKSPIPTALKTRGWGEVQIVEQPGKYGIPDAIARGSLTRLGGELPILVLFADELYDDSFADGLPTTTYFQGSTDEKRRDISWAIIRSCDAQTGRVNETVHDFMGRFKVTQFRNSRKRSKCLGTVESYIRHLQQNLIPS